MAKPVIGLTGPSQFTPYCVRMVEEMLGGEPLMLYMNETESIKKWVKRCDGIVLCGGVDIHPSIYNGDVVSNSGLTRFDYERDLREMQILETTFETNKPLFGICRGHQMIGVNKGLRLITDISHGAVCHQPGGQIDLKEWEPTHSVELIDPADFAANFKYDGSPERRLINRRMAYDPSSYLWVNSFHHQALLYTGTKKTPDVIGDVKVYGKSFVGLNECKYIIELMAGQNWVSAQWHPEYDWKTNTPSRVVLSYFKNML